MQHRNRYSYGQNTGKDVKLCLSGATLCLALVGACTGPEPRDTGQALGSTSQAITTQLNTFIGASNFIQIDQFSPGTTNPADANLFTGNDPADGTASVNGPGPALNPPSVNYIDWNDLGSDLANHRVQDLDDPITGRDTTSFPRSNECVGSSNVLSKMDLTYIASANNNQF